MTTPVGRGRLDEVVPFASLWAPLVAAARPVPDADGALAPSARADLGEVLLRRLAGIGADAALALFGPPGDPGSDRRHRAFVADGPAPLRAAFPVLDDLVAATVARWEEATAELAARLAADRAAVAGLLGEDPTDLVVTRVRGPLGDPHLGGRAVLGLRTAAGGEVVAKPRGVEGEAALAAVIGALAATGERWPGARATEVVARDSHGWSRRVVPGPVVDGPGWWARAGAVLALAHVAGVTDLHHGNVVAAADGPVLVDLECLGAADLVVADGSPARPTWVGRESVAATGLVPGTYRSGGPVAVDLAGLGAGAERPDGTFGAAWAGLGTDAVRRERRPASVPPTPNRGRDASGRPTRVDLDALLRGLDETLALLARRPEATAALDEVDGARLVLRPTAVYDEVLDRATGAEALASARAFGTALAPPPWRPPEALALGPGHTVVDAAERAALARLDVPVHRSRGADLLLDGGGVLVGVVARPGPVRLRERARVAPADRRAQREVVRLRFEQAGATSPPPLPLPTGGPGADPDPTSAALDAVARLWSERLGAPGAWRWLEAGYLPTLGRVEARTFATSLWDGADGIALALAGAAAVALRVGDPRADELADAARAVLGADPAPTRTPWARPAPPVRWWDTGFVGHGLARAWAAGLLGDAELGASGAEMVGRALAPDDGAEDARLAPVDLVGGWSGVVAAGAAAAHALGPVAGAPVAEAVAERGAWLVAVVRRQRDDLAAGTTPERTLGRLGLAHGLPGVVLGLARAAALGVDTAADLAGELAEVEGQRVARRGGVGGRVIGHGRTRRAEATWCWGTAGHLLAHADPDVARVAPPDPVHRDRSLAVVLDQAPAQVAHLCCGRAGHLEALATVGVAPGGARAAAAAAEVARELARGLAGGTLAFDPTVSFPAAGMMTGRAGVAWALLRHAHPGLLPSVLTVAGPAPPPPAGTAP